MDKDKLKVVKNLPVDNYMDIPGMLRKIADDIEAGKLDNPRSVLMLCECYPSASSMYLELFNLGEHNDAARVIGLLTMASHQTGQFAAGDIPQAG